MNSFFKKVSRIIPDKLFIKIKYRIKFGKKLNLKNPKTFNEKLQWMKLYYRNPLLVKLVDKGAVKEYVAEKIGEEYVIPTLGVFNSFDEIDFDKLPNKFVLKCTHDCGSVVICRDKEKFDIQTARKKLSVAMKRNYYYGEREWPYKTVKPRIIAEEFIENKKSTDLKDYKFFCFDGKVRALFIATDRNVLGKEVKFDFFDEQFNHLPIRNGHDNVDVEIEKPEGFEKMKELASVLSKGFPQVRVDFYDVDGRILFGELTFFHFAGFVKFEPEEWDYKFGEWVDLKV